MARSISNVPSINNEQETKPVVSKVNDNRPGSKYALEITCICGGRYYPFTHKISDKYTDGIPYRCAKCGKDINVRLVPVNV